MSDFIIFIAMSMVSFVAAIDVMCRIQTALLKSAKTKAKLIVFYGMPLIICVALGIWVMNLPRFTAELGVSGFYEFLLMSASAFSVVASMFYTSDRRYPELSTQANAWTEDDSH
ncbi:hypothetical protein [Ferrimonas sp.]|uniref:hypothetical protein n=1 Tax=Ferrimonas sp. TaxID=2080861 RepID=UPI003A94B049